MGYDVSKLAAQQVYSSANITPRDVDVIELHDCFSANELITYEALGLCPEGILLISLSVQSFLLLKGKQTPLSNSENEKVTKNAIDFVSKMEIYFQISQRKKIEVIDPVFSNWV